MLGRCRFRRDAKVAESGNLALRERLVGEVRQGRTAPQSQRSLQRRGGPLATARGELASPLADEPLEALRVEALGIKLQLVAVLARRDHALETVVLRTRERLAQPRDV